MRRPTLPKNIEELAQWYMRYISPISLVVALFIDTFFLLRRVDTLLTSLVLFFYLALAAFIIILINLIQTGRLQHWMLLKVTPMLPVVSQFAFGGLFIAFLSLYSRSAAFTFSWFFVAALAALLIANERFVRFYMRFAFQISILFTVLFSFFIFYLPLTVGSIGPHMFVASGVASLVAIVAFLYLHHYLTPELVERDRTVIARAIAGIFLAFNVLYFTNAIPPLPFALKEAGVYHGVLREGNAYHLRAEGEEWYERLFPHETVLHLVPGSSAYLYTAIFAPSGFSTTIVHEWQRFDERAQEWITEESVPFTIVGGREGGYRGYSVKGSPTEGKWRANVITRSGLFIGRVSFRVEMVAEPVPVEVVVRL